MNRKLLSAGILFLTGAMMATATHAGAKEKKTTTQPYTITGDIAGMPVHMVLLEKVRANDSVVVADSQRSDANGHFEFKGQGTEQALYRIHMQQEKFVFLAMSKGVTKIAAQWPLADYNVTAGGPTIELKRFIDTLKAHIAAVNGAMGAAEAAKGSGDPATVANANTTASATKIRYNKMLKAFADTTKNEPNAILAARMLSAQEEMAYMESFDKALDKRFPGTEMTKDYHSFLALTKENLPASTEPGAKAPELKLDDVGGKQVALSSFKGKYVLVDFWASWCGPCRAENPVVLGAYNKYKERNFTILGVSLDNNKENWIKAIVKDGLPWQQVSDLKGWSSTAAAKYGVRSIPANFLVGPDGVILAKNLRGPQLEEKLEEVLKK